MNKSDIKRLKKQLDEAERLERQIDRLEALITEIQDNPAAEVDVYVKQGSVSYPVVINAKHNNTMLNILEQQLSEAEEEFKNIRGGENY